MATEAKTERDRMLIETKANIIEMRCSLARSLDTVAEQPQLLDDDSVVELHTAADLLLGAIKQIEIGMENAKKRAAERKDEKVA